MGRFTNAVEILFGRTNRYGRREAFLILVGFLWVIYGIGVIVAPPARPHPDTAMIQDAIPPAVYAAMWIFFGLVSFLSGLLQRTGGRFGYGALIAMPMFKMASCVLLWGSSLLPHHWHVPHDDRGWVSAIIWGGLVLMVQIVAGWPESKVPMPNLLAHDEEHEE